MRPLGIFGIHFPKIVNIFCAATFRRVVYKSLKYSFNRIFGSVIVIFELDLVEVIFLQLKCGKKIFEINKLDLIYS